LVSIVMKIFVKMFGMGRIFKDYILIALIHAPR